MENTKALEVAKQCNHVCNNTFCRDDANNIVAQIIQTVIDDATADLQSQLAVEREIISQLGWSLMVAKPAQERVLKGVQLIEHYEQTAYADICKGYDVYLAYKAAQQPKSKE